MLRWLLINVISSHSFHATMAVISSHTCLRRLKHHHKNLARAFWCAIHFCRPGYLIKTRQEACRSIDTTKVKWPICKENWPKTNKKNMTPYAVMRPRTTWAQTVKVDIPTPQATLLGKITVPALRHWVWPKGQTPPIQRWNDKEMPTTWIEQPTRVVKGRHNDH
jgi:hypothetical protein